MKNIDERLLNLEKKIIKDKFHPTDIVYVDQETDEVDAVIKGGTYDRAGRSYWRKDGESEQIFLDRVEKAEKESEKNENAG